MNNLVKAFLIMLGLTACDKAQQIPVTHIAPQLLAETPACNAPACGGVDSLAIRLFSVLAAKQEENIVFSPASLEGVLHLLQQGARGSSAAELAALPMGKRGVATAMAPVEANALFIAETLKLRKGINPAQIIKAPFETDSNRSAHIINTWVSQHTKGLIKGIVSANDISPFLRIVAANTIYLKERWLHPFKPASTNEEADFTLSDGSTVKVAMMYNSGKYHYAEGEDWQAVALPYRSAKDKGEPGYFIGILPTGNVNDFVQTLTPQKYHSIRTALASATEETTYVNLPRFTLNPGTYSLKAPLRHCGLNHIFSESADFSGFCMEPLYVSDVIQRCYVEVNEQGTEAAAATAAFVQYKCIQEKSYRITFNRPFIWVITDLHTAAAPYFMGVTQKP